MNKQESFLADVASGRVTIISEYNRGYVFRYCGLMGIVEFDQRDGNVTRFDIKDIPSVFSPLNQHADKFNFSLVSIKDPVGNTAMNLMYVEPVDIRPWMRKLISASLSCLYWCVYRNTGNMSDDAVFRMYGALKDTAFYTRNVSEEIFSRRSSMDSLDLDDKTFAQPTTKVYS